MQEKGKEVFLQAGSDPMYLLEDGRKKMSTHLLSCKEGARSTLYLKEEQVPHRRDDQKNDQSPYKEEDEMANSSTKIAL